jgi:streptogramin lyase
MGVCDNDVTDLDNQDDYLSSSLPRRSHSGALFLTRFGTITMDGQITEFDLPNPSSGPYRMSAGPDGNLWFTEYYGNRIGQITTDGVLLAEYDIPTPNSLPTGITPGPDGNVWFTEYGGNKLARLTLGN